MAGLAGALLLQLSPQGCISVQAAHLKLNTAALLAHHVAADEQPGETPWHPEGPRPWQGRRDGPPRPVGVDEGGGGGGGYREGEAGRERSLGAGSRGSRGNSDTDRDWADYDREGWEAERYRRGRPREVPTASIFVKGLPEDADESDLYLLFQGCQNLSTIKVLRDRHTGGSKGMAFVDFATVDDARVLMESEGRWQLQLGGQQLLLDYSHGAPASRSGGSQSAELQPALDWICDMCTAVNFARRLECYQCYTARPANPQRVTTDLSEPSNILKVSGLEPQTSEEELYTFLAAVVPNILDLRVIKDKFTGAPRGFAFVELGSIAEAGKLMLASQGQMVPGQYTPLKICYAKAKEQLVGSAAPAPGDGSAPGSTALGAGLGQSGELHRQKHKPAAEVIVIKDRVLL
eukprot:gene7965-8162_t